MYAHEEDKIYVNLFASGQGEVSLGDGKLVKLTQATAYPWEGKVTLQVSPEKPTEFVLCVRIPGWALGRPVPSDLYRFRLEDTPSVRIVLNGKPVEVAPDPDLVQDSAQYRGDTRGNGEQQAIVAAFTNQLQADRQTRNRIAAGNRDRGR